MKGGAVYSPQNVGQYTTYCSVMDQAHIFALLVVFIYYFCFDILSLCVFRLEQPYLNANASFFEALSCCSRLQRLCLISRSGTFDPSATEAFMERCCHVIMCHMFMGGTLVACRTLQKALHDRSVLVCEDVLHFKHKMRNLKFTFSCVFLDFQLSARP